MSGHHVIQNLAIRQRNGHDACVPHGVGGGDDAAVAGCVDIAGADERGPIAYPSHRLLFDVEQRLTGRDAPEENARSALEIRVTVYENALDDLSR